MLEEQMLVQVEDALNMLSLRLESITKSFTKLETEGRLAEQKKLLENIARELKRGQNELKNLQFNIKKCPEVNQQDLNAQFGTLRASLSELDLAFSQKKKELKFDIHLVEEREKLELFDEKMDIVVDDEEMDDIDNNLAQIGVGRAQQPVKRHGSAVYGASNADNNFVTRFEMEKQIENEKKKQNPARYYQTMNFELKYMKQLQEQKDTILELDPKKQKLAPFKTRFLGCCQQCIKSTVCDLQSMFLILMAIASFVFYLSCLALQERGDGTEVPDTSI